MGNVSRKEKEKEFKQKMIMDAAKIVFKEKGYSDAKIDDIAAQAGFAKGSIYNYFESKKELMTQIIIEILLLKHDALEKIVKGPGSAVDKMKEVIKLHYIIVTNPEASTMMKYFNGINETLAFFSEIMPSLRPMEEFSVEIISKLISQFCAEKGVCPATTNHYNLAKLFICYGKGVLMEVLGNRLRDDIDEDIMNEMNNLLIKEHVNFLMYSLDNVTIIEKEIK